MSTTTITATYNPTTNTLSLSPDGNIEVAQNATETITINLSCNPNAGGTATFAASPVTWGSNGKPPGAQVSGASTSQLTITETNNNSGTSDASYPFTVNVTYTATAFKDPTIVNEGTNLQRSAA